MYVYFCSHIKAKDLVVLCQLLYNVYFRSIDLIGDGVYIEVIFSVTWEISLFESIHFSVFDTCDFISSYSSYKLLLFFTALLLWALLYYYCTLFGLSFVLVLSLFGLFLVLVSVLSWSQT